MRSIRTVVAVLVAGSTLTVGCSQNEPAALRELPAFEARFCESVGTVFTEGLLVLNNVGDSDVVLESIGQHIDGDVIEPLGAVVAGPGRRIAGHQRLHGFPPQREGLGDRSPVAGFTIPAAGWGKRLGAEVLFGYEVVAEGKSTRQEVEVNFSIDGQSQGVTYQAELAVRAKPEPC